MSSSGQVCELSSPAPVVGMESWYAIHTRARHEKIVDQRLRGQGLTTFLPLVTEVHRWSDRQKTVELPLFSSYLFIRSALTHEERLRVFRVDGVLGFVGGHGEGTSIPDQEIHAVRKLLSQNTSWCSHPFLKVGQRVRIRGGALDGIEGIFQARNGDNTLVVSVNAIQRSLAVRIEGYDVEVV